MDCPQPLLIHADGTGSCSLPGCLDHDTLTEAVLRHRHVVNCHAVLGDRCAVLPPGADPGARDEVIVRDVVPGHRRRPRRPRASSARHPGAR